MTLGCLDDMTVLALATGQLPAGDLEARTHLDSCPSCRDLVAAIAAGEPGQVARRPGEPVGRYVIDRELGRGAMAAVYAARDPELDREVAVKLVHFADTDSASRLIREARAMAKLTHPNVTRVYDTGTDGDSVFLAMELVAGQDLAGWLAEKRPWREVLRVFVRAAEGLAAAHDAGLVHRDFKPGNVLVGGDGRVLVTDFGLVNAPASSARELVEAPAGGGEAIALTRTGAVVGTPAYMAPEVFEGGEADELSDQFSFAVALYEALYGRRPFAGDNLAELADNVCAGRIRPAPSGSPVPRRIQRAVLRGLGPRSRRYPSIRALSQAIAVETRPRRWIPVAIGGALVVTAVAAAGLWQLRASSEDPCGSSEALAEVWSPGRRALLGASFASSGSGGAGDLWRTTRGHLDAFADSWVDSHRAACMATRRGAQSGELLDRRMQCLGARLAELDETVELLATAGASVTSAPRAAASLTPVRECDMVVALGAMVAPPPDVDDAELAAVRADIARVHALRKSGKPGDVIELADRTLARAEALGYPPIIADAGLAVAIVRMVSGDADRAIAALDRVTLAAESGRHYRAKAQSSSIRLELAYQKGDYDAALEHSELARAALEAAGGDPALEADVESVLGWIAGRRGELTAAEKHLRRAVDLRTEALGAEDLATARARANLGTLLSMQGKRDDALAEIEAGFEIERSQLGERHPEVALSMGNVAILKSKAGEHEEAIAMATRALELFRATIPDTHPKVAFLTLQVAGVYHDARRYEEALEHQRRAVELYEKALGAEHPDLARALTNLAATLAELERHDELIAVATRALAMTEKLVGPETPAVARISVNLGVGLVGAGRAAEALAHFERARGIDEKTYGPEDPRLLSSLLGIASCHAAAGARDKQRQVLERAAALGAKAQTPRQERLAERAAAQLADP